MPDLFPTLTLAGLGSPSARLELIVDRVDPADPTGVAVIEAVRSFARAGEYGGYAAPGKTADQSRLSVTGDPKTLLKGLHFELQAAHIDPLAFQILRNMMATLNLEGAGITSILVREVRQGNLARVELPIADEDNEEDVYPGLSDDLSFPPDWEDSDSIKFRRVVVEARQKLSPDQVIVFQQRVESWLVLLQAGGFCLPMGPPDEAVCSSGSVSQLDEMAVEIAVTVFLASETAWNVLFNILDAIARTQAALAVVTVA